jgi:hypothetical protein
VESFHNSELELVYIVFTRLYLLVKDLSDVKGFEGLVESLHFLSECWLHGDVVN